MPRPTILIEAGLGPRAPITPEEWGTARRSLPGPDVNPCRRCRAGASFGFRYSRDVALWACAEHREEVEAEWRGSRRSPDRYVAPTARTPAPSPEPDLFSSPLASTGGFNAAA